MNGAFTEDQVKKLLVRWLTKNGHEAQVAYGNKHGVDIEARKGRGRWLIEAKGIGSRPAMRVNYFLSAIGEILQRMDDREAKYSVAFPDDDQFRGLWERLPALAKERMKLSALFVDSKGIVREG
ncbi:MAG: hypothetical protein ABSG17_06315 [Spirochaetia bacterium]|jgi:hypothetical protein